MSISHRKNKKGLYEPVLPNMEDWPIFRIGKQREQFIEQLTDDTVRRVLSMTGDELGLREEIAKAYYLEKIRMRTEPWAVDPKEEKNFWAKVKKRMIRSSLQKGSEEDSGPDERLLQEIIHSYANEIAGDFQPSTYNVAKRLLPIGFARLLNTASGRNVKRIWSNQFQIGDRLKLSGPLEKIRELSLEGTVLILPTHFSNLDSILVGWSIHTLGLPAVTYGAGLNLFNSKTLGYFMGRLGAYTIDRRKKNLLYLQTLKNYSRMTIHQGCHTLFFPGGTRSRSGEIESKLKLGLLSTMIDAQRMRFEADQDPGRSKKIFVVPLVLGYHFVLEAAGLIDQHLSRQGKEKYFIDKDPFPSSKKLAEFLWKFFSAKSEIVLSFGEPMDLFGNPVDEKGESVGPNGNHIDLSSYFLSGGKLIADEQRDSEYTKMLATKVIEKLHINNRVMSSHLVAYVAMEMLNKKHRRLDVYGLLRLPEDERVIPYQQFHSMVERTRAVLKSMVEQNKIKLADHMHGDTDRLIRHGIDNIGVYHAKKPLFINKDGDISSQDLNLLYYYHNRLNGYGIIELL